MNQIQVLILLIIFGVIVVTIYNNTNYPTKENFKPNTQNYIYTNKFDVANQLQYGEDEEPALDPNSNNMGPSSHYRINEITQQVDNQEFKRTYMSYPSSKYAKYAKYDKAFHQ